MSDAQIDWTELGGGCRSRTGAREGIQALAEKQVFVEGLGGTRCHINAAGISL